MAGGITAEYVSVNGLARAERTGNTSRSSEDGDRTRYQGGTHGWCVRESGRYASTWVVPQDGSLVPWIWDEAFFLAFIVKEGIRHVPQLPSVASLPGWTAGRRVTPPAGPETNKNNFE